MEDMKVAQEFAQLNRFEMATRICKFLKLDILKLEKIESIHNYINFEDKIIRKGAISARANEKVIIPFNMRDGSLLAMGKGNQAWNNSAPHGAGRTMSRTKANATLSLDDYRKSMAGIWSSSVSKKTLDEAPSAYKNYQSILDNIKDTLDIIKIIKPVYNFKAAE
jgi:RNA-splicing ligase RtcB